MNNKTKKTILIGLSFFVATFAAFSQTSGTVNLLNQELVYRNLPCCPSDGYNDKTKVITVTPNTFYKLTYTNNTSNWLIIYTNTTTYVTTASQGTSTVIVNSSDGQIFLKSSYEFGYFEFLNPTFVIFSVSYQSDNTSAMSDNSFINKNLSVLGKLGVGTDSPQKKLEIWDGTSARFTFSGTSCTTGYEVAQTIDNTGYKLNVTSSSRNYKVAISGSDYFTIGKNENISLGKTSLPNVTTGTNNVAFGYAAAGAVTTGSNNIGIGQGALAGNTTGSNNIGIGQGAGRYITNGSTANTNASNSIFVGYGAKAMGDNQSNQIVIGYNATGNGSNTMTLGNTAITKTMLNGNVCIGTTTDAGYNLNIHTPATTTDTYSTIQLHSANYGYIIKGGLTQNYGATLTFNSNNAGTITEQLRLNYNGNVGINTPNPQSRLEVTGTTRLNGDIWGALKLSFQDNAQFPVTTANVSNLNLQSFSMPNYGIAAPSTGQGADLWIAGYNAIRMFTYGNATPRLNILSNGNVGIGTPNPDQLLTVNGTIHAKEVLVDLNPPLADYVFAPDYRLRTLTEVEQYVKTNNHLPDIPSAGQVKQNGMNMGEMQNKLLQKIEELTLYTIQQQKQIDELKNQIKKLKK